MKKNYFSMVRTGRTAEISIYGDITSWPWEELGEVSAANLSKQLQTLGDVDEINVHISSYGGEVKEGLAIYNALKNHTAKVRTFCDGFACSIASVIFMAGDERIMNESSLLMIHNAWSYAEGNAQELRKQADDLEKITQASVVAYKAHSTLTEEEIKALMDAESWILPQEAIDYGFATATEKAEQTHANQNAKARLIQIVKAYRAALDDEDEGEEEPAPETDTGDDEEPAPKKDEDGEEEPETPEDTPDDGENDDGEENADDEEPEDEENQKETAQQWSGFFNALMKM